jgi:hypothetical protein
VTPQRASVPKAPRDTLRPGYRDNASPLYFSESGGIAFIAPDAHVQSETWGYSGVEKTQESALNRLTQLYEGIATLHNFAG